MLALIAGGLVIWRLSMSGIMPIEDITDLKFMDLTEWPKYLLLTIVFFGTFGSEDLACITAGILVAKGGLSFYEACMACFGGIFLGDLGIYWLGRLFGEHLLDRAPFRWFISRSAVRASEHWYQHRGVWVIIASRFMPGTRVPIFFASGVLKADSLKVALVLGIAGIMWVPLLVSLAFFFGESMQMWFEAHQYWAVGGVLMVIVASLFVINGILPLFSYRGRRLMYGRWKRWTRWEFWPAKMVYPPVVMHIVYLAFKYRSFSLPTLANPMEKMGGLINESKIDILSQLKDSGLPVADFSEIRETFSKPARFRLARKFVDSKGGYPVVLKPEQGERGKGVVIVKNEVELQSNVDSQSGNLIIQEFIDGNEYGVFYVKFPNEKEGRITSLTHKSYTYVTGDGIHDLEHLILENERTVCYAKRLFEAHEERLYDVPEKGERIQMVELGTHSRGCLFLDRNDLITEALQKTLNDWNQRVEGFAFGRFDIKVPSEDALKGGESMQILELNLLTSEPTHIYDPRHKLSYARDCLKRHWEMAFEIGKQYRQLGYSAISNMSIIGAILNYYLSE